MFFQKIPPSEANLYKSFVNKIFSSLPIFLTIIFILLFYFWVATAGSFRFDKGNEPTTSQYEMLADAFLSGHSYLSLSPRPELLSLPNPYDPKANEPYRERDLSLYKNKYYLYHGAVPVLFLYAPYKLITGNHLSNYFVGCILTCGIFLWASMIILYLKKTLFPNVPKWMVVLSIMVTGFANYTTYFLLMPFHYEIAELSGIFFLVGAYYWFIRTLSEQKPPLYVFYLGSMFLGLAFGSRQFLILVAFVLPIILYVNYRRNVNDKSYIKNILLALLLPFAFCLFCQAIYNYLRFDNPFEFGLKYQMSPFDMYHHPLFDTEIILLGLYAYFIYLPVIDLHFPYIRMNGICPSFPNYKQMINYLPTVGIIPGIPFILLMLFSPVLYFLTKYIWRGKGFENNHPFPLWQFLILFVSSILLLVYVSGFPSPALRYGMPAATPAILASIIVWFYFDSSFPPEFNAKYFLRGTGLVLGIYCVVFGMSLGINSWSGRMKWGNTVVYKKLESFFDTPVKSIAYAFDLIKIYSEREKSHYQTGIIGFTSDKVPSLKPVTGDLFSPDSGETIFWFDGKSWDLIRDDKKIFNGPVTIKIKFKPEVGAREPLITTGSPGTGDIIYIKYLSSDKALFGIDHIGSPGEISGAVKIDPEHIYDLRISIGSFYFPADFNEYKNVLAERTKDRDKSYRYLESLYALKNTLDIRLDGKEILNCRIDFHYTKPEDILFGENKILGSFAPRFSGEILGVKKAG